MMNWKEIKKKCPKAWSALKEDHDTKEYWGLIDDPDVWWMDGMDISENELRHLFDFFDEKGLFVEIKIRFEDRLEDRLEDNLFYDYEVHPYFIFFKNDRVNSRSEAEEAAFTKAFEILEEQLNEGKKKCSGNTAN